MGLIHGDIYAVSSSEQLPPLSPNYKADYMLLRQEMKILKCQSWEEGGGGWIVFFFHSHLTLVVKKKLQRYVLRLK